MKKAKVIIDKQTIKKQHKVAKLIKKWSKEKTISPMSEAEFEKWLKQDKVKI